MPTIPIIIIAGVILLVAVFLMAREFGNARRDQESQAKSPAAPTTTATATVAQVAAAEATVKTKKNAIEPAVPSAVTEHDEADVTKVGVVPPKTRPLPTLSSADGDDEPVQSESRAVVVFEENAENDESTGPTDLILVSAYGQTDCGLKRRKNEDSHLISRPHSLYVVADGMGGYGGGDIASKLAVETIQRVFERGDFHLNAGRNGVPTKALELAGAIESANAVIFAEANRNSELHGMGTTVIGARFSERKQRVFIAHVGDSRCYRWRRGHLKLLTADHTLAARGVEGPMSDHIRRALGIAPSVKVDLLVDKPMPGDVYLLCSDGLTKMIKDAEVERLVTDHSKDLDQAASELIKAANHAGGKDNTTVILVGVNDGQRTRAESSAAISLQT